MPNCAPCLLSVFWRRLSQQALFFELMILQKQTQGHISRGTLSFPQSFPDSGILQFALTTIITHCASTFLKLGSWNFSGARYSSSWWPTLSLLILLLTHGVRAHNVGNVQSGSEPVGPLETAFSPVEYFLTSLEIFGYGGISTLAAQYKSSICKVAVQERI